MTEETSALPVLLSGSTFIVALMAFYIARALWIARREWPECRTDTKILYLLVAPPLTLAVDILSFTDRIFWSGQSGAAGSRKRAARPALVGSRLRTKPARS